MAYGFIPIIVAFCAIGLSFQLGRRRASSERRRLKRIEVYLPVEVVDGSKTHESQLTDISASGMFLATHKPIGMGRRIFVRISLPTATLEIPAQVVRGGVCNRTRRSGLGVTFPELDRKSLQILRRFCELKNPDYRQEASSESKKEASSSTSQPVVKIKSKPS